MSGEWAILGKYPMEHQAVLLKAALEDEGIACVLHNRRDSAYGFLGEIEVYVKVDDFLKAKHLMEKLDL